MSPTLFNLYISRLPLLPKGIKLITYADDCTLLSSSTNTDENCSKLNRFLPVVRIWIVSNQLEISPEKSTATLFTTWTKEVKIQLDLVIGNQHIPTVTRLKYLELRLITCYRFVQMVNQCKTRCKHGRTS